MSGVNPSAQVILDACKAGLHVVSANKRAITDYWPQLQYFIKGDRRLRFGAAVGGAVPVLETLRIHAGQIQSFRGVINGTCNYILSQMRRGIPFESALQGARDSGFAETDPSVDISGSDSADKLFIIAATGFQEALRLDAIGTQGIGPQTSPSSWLVAELSRAGGSVTAKVAPTELEPGDFLAGAHGAENRVEVRLSDGRAIRLKGLGAGRAPTSTAVFGDLLEVWREHCELHLSAQDRLRACMVR
jgi:homoserine dehydrogenase